jgi:aspartate aminotransferase, mitochondrial
MHMHVFWPITRTTACTYTVSAAQEAARVESQMKAVARPMYSNPPLHGALLVASILQDSGLRATWLSEVAGMATRILDVRALLRSNLEQLGSQHSWAHITDQVRGLQAMLAL